MSYGLIPRVFNPEDENFARDNIIYEEREQVSEMYFIQGGTVEIGFTLAAHDKVI